MIDKRLIPVDGLKKEPYSGSHFGMRYLFQSEENKKNFTVYIYPEPWAFDKTPKDQIQSAVFPMTEEGMDHAINWLLKEYDAQKELWQTASKNCMHIVNQK